MHAWDQAAASDDGSNRARLHLFRVRSVARSGDHRSAVAALEALAPAKPGDNDHLFESARVYAIVAGAAGADSGLATAEREESARRFAERALVLLQTTKASNFFQDAKRVDVLKQHKDFDPLRQNPEFQAILKALDVTKGKSGT
jgi:hypothetical protein